MVKIIRKSSKFAASQRLIRRAKFTFQQIRKREIARISKLELELANLIKSHGKNNRDEILRRYVGEYISSQIIWPNLYIFKEMQVVKILTMLDSILVPREVPSS
ncbi:hypothetical protein TNCT_733521 [Trichonephila clavata]|uniref:Uncharacterized protein n=1 Tax=Trichonephila clavata TaxID=2740835 RepID=A0A8X6F2X5_TRICU|nr:hypothetical protein TNCT_733521 [Trichonephila clavata]